MVKPLECTEKSIRLTGFKGTDRVSLAKVWIYVGDYALHHTTPAVEDATESVLQGLDLGILEYLLDVEKQVRVHAASEQKA